MAAFGVNKQSTPFSSPTEMCGYSIMYVCVWVYSKSAADLFTKS
jgi:hypothetical protein